jgi:hypothetical protein
MDMSKEIKQEPAPQEVEEKLAEELAVEEIEEQPQEAEATKAEAEVPVEAEAAEEEAKPKRKKKEEEIVEERFYTIPLQKALIRPPKKRAPRAMQLIKIFVTKHMKMDMKVSDEEEAEELPANRHSRSERKNLG